VSSEIAAVGSGNVAVICPASQVERCSAALDAVGIDHGVAIEQGLNHQVTVVPVGIVKGLELDATVVVDPQGILDEQAQGTRALYVALTRATKLLTVVHVGDLPDVMAPLDRLDDPEPASVR
jgi:DNA helicase IV